LIRGKKILLSLPSLQAISCAHAADGFSFGFLPRPHCYAPEITLMIDNPAEQLKLCKDCINLCPRAQLSLAESNHLI
jgi:hypothetical protein